MDADAGVGRAVPDVDDDLDLAGSRRPQPQQRPPPTNGSARRQARTDSNASVSAPSSTAAVWPTIKTPRREGNRRPCDTRHATLDELIAIALQLPAGDPATLMRGDGGDPLIPIARDRHCRAHAQHLDAVCVRTRVPPTRQSAPPRTGRCVLYRVRIRGHAPESEANHRTPPLPSPPFSPFRDTRPKHVTYQPTPPASASALGRPDQPPDSRIGRINRPGARPAPDQRPGAAINGPGAPDQRRAAGPARSTAGRL